MPGRFTLSEPVAMMIALLAFSSCVLPSSPVTSSVSFAVNFAVPLTKAT